MSVSVSDIARFARMTTTPPGTADCAVCDHPPDDHLVLGPGIAELRAAAADTARPCRTADCDQSAPAGFQYCPPCRQRKFPRTSGV